jgi:hypothetical protein
VSAELPEAGIRPNLVVPPRRLLDEAARHLRVDRHVRLQAAQRFALPAQQEIDPGGDQLQIARPVDGVRQECVGSERLPRRAGDLGDVADLVVQVRQRGPRPACRESAAVAARKSSRAPSYSCRIASGSASVFMSQDQQQRLPRSSRAPASVEPMAMARCTCPSPMATHGRTLSGSCPTIGERSTEPLEGVGHGGR